MTVTARLTYHFTTLRVVPHVHLGAFVNIGVIVHARTAEFLGMRAVMDEAELERMIPDVDVELLARYLRCCDGICRGDPDAGPIALLPLSERFHWLSAPRSDVLQAAPVHVGLCDAPESALTDLFAKLVRPEPRKKV
jgi:hypothetical protein